MPRKARRWTRKDKRLVKLEVKQQSRKSKTVVAGVRGLGVVLMCFSPSGPRSFVSASGGCCFRGAVCSSAPLGRLESEELARSLAHLPPARQSRLSHLPTVIGLRDPVGSADNLNLACVQGARLEHTVRLRGPAVSGRQGGFAIRAIMLNISAICCHGTEGYLGLRVANI